MLIATAGHVDHGKSTLVTALTGTDPDRWAEEKARGMTIDLGFAFRGDLSFVDVPGHVRFLRNMLAGVGGVDAALFVVAATEGWKPQSEEHLRILELLGIRRGVVALTKVGLVDDELRELARLDLADHLAGSALAGAEVVEVDVRAGIGVADLRTALDRLDVPPATDAGRPRLWVDRAFAARGAGTVVTGTLTGGVMIERERAVLATLPDVRVDAGRAGAVDDLAGHPYVAALEASPFSPPAPDGVDRGELRELVRRGLVVERDGAWFSPAAVDAAARTVAGLLEMAPEGVTVAQVRDALGATRKHVLPLLAVLDATGVTRRRGDVRIAGPRLPSPGGDPELSPRGPGAPPR